MLPILFSELFLLLSQKGGYVTLFSSHYSNQNKLALFKAKKWQLPQNTSYQTILPLFLEMKMMFAKRCREMKGKMKQRIQCKLCLIIQKEMQLILLFFSPPAPFKWASDVL